MRVLLLILVESYGGICLSVYKYRVCKARIIDT